MGALRPLPDGAAERVAPMLQEARSKAEYQRVQCVWLRARLGLNSRQIAEALGWQASSVRHVQARYFEKGGRGFARSAAGRSLPCSSHR